jgi:hypothetical protein
MKRRFTEYTDTNTPTTKVVSRRIFKKELISSIEKSNLAEVAWVLFYVGEWHWEMIIGVLNVLKCDFAEVDEVMFYDVERPFQSILCILYIQKSDLDEVAVVLF